MVFEYSSDKSTFYLSLEQARTRYALEKDAPDTFTKVQTDDFDNERLSPMITLPPLYNGYTTSFGYEYGDEKGYGFYNEDYDEDSSDSEASSPIHTRQTPTRITSASYTTSPQPISSTSDFPMPTPTINVVEDPIDKSLRDSESVLHPRIQALLQQQLAEPERPHRRAHRKPKGYCASGYATPLPAGYAYPEPPYSKGCSAVGTPKEERERMISVQS